ncbi:UDP-glucose dehydrogenase family protein [Eubacterium callanderi]|uniref:UDP-glucose 6-dehydrogenase n=1 Tax=Eubacterium limosum TaxID=1736 RepID=A0A6N3D2P0_EUBLI|nr:UDP-glucose/GDP-mannose dehydrogenase family protein [Eubacterium callanderi]MBO1704211.1 UDP-glucose/GDP-mannose dehydrogenase family protein [Eubacterium callanderi]
MKLAIAGTGYVGLVTAVCMAEKGHHVTCVDINEEIVNILNQGKSPIYEKDLEALMLKNKDRIVYTTDYKKAYKDVEVIFIGVGTPEKKDGSANLSYVYSVVDQIAETVENDCVVVVKSTVPIGTNDKVEKRLNENKKNNVKFDVISNPEFLAQGTAVEDTLHASRIVIGSESKDVEETMLKIYENFNVPIVTTNRRSAEMIKYASNDFLALKISYINEIANLCEEIGANIDDVAKGMGYDPRIGNKFLKAGIGYGGSCFPKDTKALHWLSNFHDHELKTVKAAIEVNEQQKMRLIKKARKYYDSFEGLTVAVLGLTFKPGTDDLREAPSLVNVPIFLEDGAKVKAWDPVGVPNFKKLYPTEIQYCQTIDETITDADICFVFTEWDEIKNYDVNKFLELMKHSIVLDGRNCLENNNIPIIGIGKNENN